VTTVPQGWGYLVGPRPMSNCVPFGTYEVVLRVLDCIPIAISEIAAQTAIIRLFKMHEMAQAQSFFIMTRSLFFMAGPPLGGVLYTYGGMALPFATVGACIIVTGVAVKLFFDKRVGVGVSEQARVMHLLRYPEFVALWLLSVSAMMATTSMELIWQLWLGVAPYNYPMLKISLLAFLTTITFAVSGALTPMIDRAIGNVRASLFGGLINGIFVALVGHPNLVVNGVPTSDAFVFICPMMQGVGTGLIMVSFMPLAIAILESKGHSRASLAIPLGTLSVVGNMSSMLASPVVAAVMQAAGVYGVSAAALMLGCIVLVATLVCAIMLRDFYGVRLTDDDVAIAEKDFKLAETAEQATPKKD